MEYRTTNAYFLRSILRIGGIESHFWYLAKKYGRYDITIFFYDADPEQLKRLKRYVRCVRITSKDTVVCKRLFCCFNREILDQCRAEQIYLVLHGDYRDMVERGQLLRKNLPVDSRIDKYLGVSRHVCDSWEKLTGIPAEFVGEPVVLEDSEKPLLFLSATRLTAEKGWNRMKILAEKLNRENVRYLWMIFTNSEKEDLLPNMIVQKPRLDITDYLPMFDAYIQLSDNEGFCLSAAEALLKGVPVIGTDLPVFHEIGMDDTNSVLLDLDMEGIPVDRIRHIRDLKFHYTEPEDRWLDYLDKAETTYVYREFRIRTTGSWQQLRLQDITIGRIPEEGEEWTIDEDRYRTITEYEKRRNVKLIEMIG